jgi:hypothetical protein
MSSLPLSDLYSIPRGRRSRDDNRDLMCRQPDNDDGTSMHDDDQGEEKTGNVVLPLPNLQVRVCRLGVANLTLAPSLRPRSVDHSMRTTPTIDETTRMTQGGPTMTTRCRRTNTTRRTTRTTSSPVTANWLCGSDDDGDDATDATTTTTRWTQRRRRAEGKRPRYDEGDEEHGSKGEHPVYSTVPLSLMMTTGRDDDDDDDDRRRRATVCSTRRTTRRS